MTVIAAPERAARPMALTDGESRACPLCPGAEAETPGESYAVGVPGRVANRPGWQLRVVPNKFPFVRPVAGDDAALGVQELVIETERHCDPADLTAGELLRVLHAYRARLLAYRELPWCRAVVAFRNVGADAGASLAHPHSQLVALDRVPPGFETDFDRAHDFWACRHECGFCRLLDRPERLAFRTTSFQAVAPDAPRFAYETWLLPRRHGCHFESVADSELGELAHALGDWTGRLRRILPGVAFNLTLHTGPGAASPSWHWHFRLLPRTAKAAGFEWATGTFVNPVPPETAARAFR